MELTGQETAVGARPSTLRRRGETLRRGRRHVIDLRSPVRNHLRAKAPLRISFAGGGTDVPPFPEQEGGCVLSATINRYAFGTLTERLDEQIVIESVDFGLALEYGIGKPLAIDGDLDLVKAPILRLAPPDSPGFELFLHSTAPPGTGLGSSSCMMVTMVGLLKEFYGLEMSEYDVAATAYHIERRELGLEGGLQDQYASTFGGFNFIEFGADEVVVNPLRVRWDTLNELEHNLLLCYTGATRRSDRIIEDQVARYQSGESESLDGLRIQKELAIEMKAELLRGRLNRFAELMGFAWEQKKRLSPKISTAQIDEIYAEAIKHGAVGGKVMGAGGGGYMLFYCDFRRKHKVVAALDKLGVVSSEFAFDNEGLRTWRASGAD
jgi:D-glycero-alpha-D-manno-heptose-7-phosphate kinase